MVAVVPRIVEKTLVARFDPTRPVILGLYADPHLVVCQGRYFIYPTTDGSDGWASTSFRAFSSDDLTTWVDHGDVFSVADETRWAQGHAWAPAVVEKEGFFYLYYTADDNIGVARGASPVGPFIDLGRPLVSEGTFEGRAIDPSVFTDDDGTAYLLWGNTTANIVPLADDMMSFDPDRVTSFAPTGFREAAWIHKRAGVYYLSWSENDTRDAEYRVRYATGPSALGPWSDQGVLVEQRPEHGVFATGHHSIAAVPGTDDWLIAYHRFAVPDGSGYRREVVLDVLHHETGGLLRPVSPSRVRTGRAERLNPPSTAVPAPCPER